MSEEKVSVVTQGMGTVYLEPYDPELLLREGPCADFHKTLMELPGCIGYDDHPGPMCMTVNATYFYLTIETAMEAALLALENEMTSKTAVLYKDVAFDLKENNDE